jgi:exo-beta-1,3-glucanase (GH17 family)
LKNRITLLVASLFIILSTAAMGSQHSDPQLNADAPMTNERPLELVIDDEWIGAGISYGEYRDGQSPNAQAPTIEQIREDLHIIKEHWGLIRMYGTRSAENVCKVIREDKLPIKLMAGAWIGAENTQEEVEANKSEVANVIRIANAYPDVVIAINVGNETQVSWSGHRMDQSVLIGYIQKAREETKVPVTTCDDYNFWNKPESKQVAEVCDFIGFHAYAMWNGQQLSDALHWTREKLAESMEMHPGKVFVHAESGWATTVHNEGEQATLIKGQPGEDEQEIYYRAYRHWAKENGLAHFYFSAFDEKWKGGPHPNEVEKHWGLFNSDRSPKQAVKPMKTQD